MSHGSGARGPARNRVTPTGEIVAAPLRGAWTGNRGILHRGREIVRFHGGDLWITCALRFKDRWHEQWVPHHFTWLYFHDEAVSFAAGHRPCAECRRGAYEAYRAAWAEGLRVEPPSARLINQTLHAERIVRGTHRRRLHTSAGPTCPRRLRPPRRRHARTRERAAPHTVDAGRLRKSRPRPRRGAATAITPPSTLAALRAGYAVQIDDDARDR